MAVAIPQLTHSLSLAPSRGPPCNCTSPQALESGQRIVLDLSFADLMREGELKSICSQLGYCWHANCSAAQPAHMVLSSVEVRRSERPRCGTLPVACREDTAAAIRMPP